MNDMEMKKIFKRNGEFIVTGAYVDEPDCGKIYSEKSLISYLINEAPNININTSALSVDDHRMAWGAYHRGLRNYTKKKFGV